MATWTAMILPSSRQHFNIAWEILNSSILQTATEMAASPLPIMRSGYNTTETSLATLLLHCRLAF